MRFPCIRLVKQTEQNFRRFECVEETSRERPKSAPFLRLKNSKRAKGLRNVKVLVNWGPFSEEKILKSLTMPKKLKGGPLWTFLNIDSVPKTRKN